MIFSEIKRGKDQVNVRPRLEQGRSKESRSGEPGKFLSLKRKGKKRGLDEGTFMQGE